MYSVARNGQHLNTALSIQVVNRHFSEHRQTDRLLFKVQFRRFEPNRAFENLKPLMLIFKPKRESIYVD